MPKLFACYLWGRIDGCHIEMHDVQFCVWEKIEECYDDLRKKWVGWKSECHIDAFLELKYVEWFEILLSNKKLSTETIKLFFVNAGGYIPEKFGELHEIGFYTGSSPEEVTKRALEKLCSLQKKPHKDDIYDVDDCISIEEVDWWHIGLIPTEKTQDFFPMYFGYGKLNQNLSEKITHHNF